jgi:DNA-binding NtrC family response regulator
MKRHYPNLVQGDSSHSRLTPFIQALAESGDEVMTPLAGISEPTRTLLALEDDPLLRDVETKLLRLEGYTVLEAEGAAKALRLAREAAAIHLLITDFSMPEVDGFELTRRFHAAHPKTPVLMVSGSLPLLRARSDLDPHGFDFLPKPFEFDELLHKVRTLLDATTPLPIRKPLCADEPEEQRIDAVHFA